MKNASLPKAKRLLPVLLLAVFVLCAQLSTLEHGIEHLSHDAQELCHAFTGFEKSSCIVGDVSASSTAQLETQFTGLVFSDIHLSAFLAYHVRAPPIFI